MESVTSRNEVPLCVDLDGTLIRSDVLWEAVLVLLKKRPWFMFAMPFWLIKGRVAFKRTVVKHADLDPSTLPYQLEFMEFLKAEHAGGRSLVLATASHRTIALVIAQYTTLFTSVIATDDGANLAGQAKADALVAQFGNGGFDYAGNSWADLPVWAAAREAIVVNPTSRRVSQGASEQCAIVRTFSDPKPTLKTYLKALRVHQWVKNILVFIPMLGAHRIAHLNLWVQGTLAFISFSLCASSVYLLNDLFDLPVDRLHPRKCHRPFASGALPISHGVVLIPVLLLMSFVIAYAWLPMGFMVVLAVYSLVTLSYSLWLKSVVMLDALLLAGLYTVRIIGGAAATDTGLSFWLLAFSIFLFFSLALVKRYSELLVLKQRGQLRTHGRGYHVEDLVMLMGFGVASGYAAVLVSALYVNSAKMESLYPHPVFLWAVSPLLLYWVSRIWLITHRGGMHDDPVIFAAKDRGTWITMAIMGILLALAAL